MTAWLTIAWRSAWHRRFGLSLVMLSVALSSFLLLAVDRLRHDVRASFAQAVSGTDLIVGAPGGSVQLLLYAVFRIGNATRTIAWDSVQALAQDRAVAWAVPIALGDSHRGYAVVGTTPAYFQHFRHGQQQPLALAEGRTFTLAAATATVKAGATHDAAASTRDGTTDGTAAGTGIRPAPGGALAGTPAGTPTGPSTGTATRSTPAAARRALADLADTGQAAVYEAVLGAEVAQRLGYRLGQKITLSHGSGVIDGAEHADKPFTVVGVLQRTGTPVDRSVHITLAGIEAIHLDWMAGVPLPGLALSAEQAAQQDLSPRSATAVLLGLKSRAAVFAVQRRIAEGDTEPLQAVLPGVALDELWGAVGLGEQALLAMSALVGVVSLAGLVAVVVTGLAQRRRELAVLRAVGAGPRQVLALLLLEGLLVTAAGALLGALLALAAVLLLGPWAQSHHGVTLRLPADGEQARSALLLLAAVVGAGVLASLLPGWRAYRLSLADGLSPQE